MPGTQGCPTTRCEVGARGVLNLRLSEHQSSAHRYNSSHKCCTTSQVVKFARLDASLQQCQCVCHANFVLSIYELPLISSSVTRSIQAAAVYSV
jgi:hypothetical protein